MSNIKKLMALLSVLLWLIPVNTLFAQETEYEDEIEELSLESVDDLGDTLDDVFDEVDEVDEVEEIDEVDEVDEVEEIDEVDEIEEVDEVDEIEEVDEVELLEDSYDDEDDFINEEENVLVSEKDEIIEETEDIEEEKTGLFEPKWERDENLLGLDISLYFTNHNATASMFEHESTNLGFGFSGEYILPEELLSKLPFEIPFKLGTLARFEFEKPKVKNPAVEKWSILNFSVGAWTEIDFNTWLSIRPQVEFGTYMNIVKAPIRNVNGLYADFETQFVGSFRFYLEQLKPYNLAFEAAPVISWVFEKKHAPLYLGLRIGVVYSIDKRGIIYPITNAIDKKNEDKLLAQQEQERLEAERLAAEEEAARLAAEEEAARLAAEEEAARLAAEAEAARIAAEEEAARLAAEEAARIAAEEEAARIAAEEEAARLAAEAEAARIAAEEEAARLAAEEEAARLAAEEEAARIAAEEEAARLAAEAEAARIAAEEEAARLAEEEAARLAAEAKAKEEIKVAKNVEVRTNEDGSIAIDIPTLAFKSNSAELTTAASNKDSINKVADILLNEDYLDFDCTIIGYVNPDNEIWTEEENQLALDRAQTVVDELVKRGVDQNRLTALHGEGRTENKEYNRRVEFKLTK